MTTRILVVDDIKSIRQTLGAILVDEGHNVAMAENGYQAIEAVKKAHFDVIFIDIKMPGINGVQTFREVKKVDPAAVVIMMTASTQEDLVRDAVQEGAYAVVYKPFSIERIVSVIESALRQTLILVVDDTFTDSETLKVMLEESGYNVIAAGSGAEALSRVKEKQFDIIFLNVKLPDMDCVDLFREVKQVDPEVAVIMMTGYSEEELLHRAVSEGAYACVYKPFNAGRILTLVGEIAHRRRE